MSPPHWRVRPLSYRLCRPERDTDPDLRQPWLECTGSSTPSSSRSWLAKVSLPCPGLHPRRKAGRPARAAVPRSGACRVGPHRPRHARHDQPRAQAHEPGDAGAPPQGGGDVPARAAPVVLRRASSFALALAISSTLARGAEPAAPEWSFQESLEGWTAAMTTPLEVRDGALVFRAAGHDPILVSPEFRFAPSALDAVEIHLRASVSGHGRSSGGTITRGPTEVSRRSFRGASTSRPEATGRPSASVLSGTHAGRSSPCA